MQSERESINRLCDPKFKVSSHYLINRKGKVYRLVRDEMIAWHAGKSLWANFRNLNKNSIGVELVNRGHYFGYQNFTSMQIKSLIKISKILIKKYNIKKKYIVGHSDVAPLRKNDPGEKFPWQKLAKFKIGIWHNYEKNFLKKTRKVKIDEKNKNFFLKYIKNIGYHIPSKNRLALLKTIKAFQRHFRKELINGIIDKECLIIAKKLNKNL